MSMTTLYGKGAVVLNDDRNTYRSLNGRIELPQHLVNKALSMGFTRHPLPSVQEQEEAATTASAAAIAAPISSGPTGVITIDALGRWSALADGTPGTRSFRYAYDRAEAPPADLVSVVGITLNGSTFLVESSDDEHLSAGETIHVTIVPFPEADAQGAHGTPLMLAGTMTRPAIADIDLPGGHPQVAAGTSAAAREHVDPKATPTEAAG